ncbi:MAG: BCD family MFS transporter [Chloroherpetonaceae bacterium]|nr:BCD family MFS transporter [Chloroherpetonaceae bacterium]MDW8018699.1 BCD family MFS transporter [Chloroherpetonaceae bacterium]
MSHLQSNSSTLSASSTKLAAPSTGQPIDLHRDDTRLSNFELETLSREIPLPRVLQICLLQFSTAIVFVLLNSTLNRVMIVEYQIDAWIVGVLIGLHNLMAGIRPIIGYYSDTHLFFGYRRTPHVILGNLILVMGVLISVHGLMLVKDNYALGLAIIVLAFTLYGLGINMTGTMFYALLADSAGEKHKAKAVTVGWFVLIFGVILVSGLVSNYLKDFSTERLISLFWIGSGFAILFTWLAMLGTEKRFAKESEIVLNTKRDMSFKNAMKTLLAHKTVYEFFIFMFVTVVAIQGQDVILEPFGAELFGMSVSETAKLTQLWGMGTMLGILTLGLFFVNRIGKKRTTYLGCAASAVGFLVICLSPLVSEAMFKAGVFLLGIGNGALTVGTLTIMMDMTTKENAGVFMGVWGAAQALANFVANTTGGAIRDLSLWLSSNHYVGYATAFTVEMILLFVAIALLRVININEFKTPRPIETLVAVVGRED